MYLRRKSLDFQGIHLAIVLSSLEASRIWPLRCTRADISDSEAGIPKIDIPAPPDSLSRGQRRRRYKPTISPPDMLLYHAVAEGTSLNDKILVDRVG